MFRETCRRFAEREIAPIWQEADREGKFPRAFFTAAAKAGLIGIAAPAEVGGADLGVHEEAICIEECARVNPGVSQRADHPGRGWRNPARLWHSRAETRLRGPRSRARRCWPSR